MYPSNNNANTTITLFSDNDINSRSIQDLSSSSCLFHFPSPLIHYEDEAFFLQQLHDILHQNDQDHNNMLASACNTTTITTHHVTKNMADSGTINDVINQQIPRKRTSKKDRHSKINTAHGPRDRRMRLSLDVARKFFGLQDMLGFDKASKTVEWLLTQSKIAIKELTRGFPNMKHSSSIVTNSASSTSDCEVLSGIEESGPEINATCKVVMPNSSCTKEKKIRGIRKATFNPLAKESREKARARARERTKEKKRQMQLGDHQTKHYCTEAVNLGSWSAFETGQESSVRTKSTTHSNINYNPPSLEVEDVPNREEVIGDSLFVTGNWSPSTIFNYQHNSAISHEVSSKEINISRV